MKLIVEINVPPGATEKTVAKAVHGILSDKDGHSVSNSVRAAIASCRIKTAT